MGSRTGQRQRALKCCVGTPGKLTGTRSSVTRTFNTTTESLRVMRDGLVEAGMTVAAMESISTY